MKRKDTIQSLYQNWKVSGEVQREYCKQVGINYNTFKNECSRLRKEGKLSKSSEPPKSTFKEVAIIEETIQEKPYCEVIFSEQDKIIISSKESLSSLRGLIECLKGG